MNRLSLKGLILRWRRHAALAIGDARYCRTGAWALCERLFSGQSPGVFFEAGAHDGWTGSNTYWLEAHYGWSGVLVEPVPGLYGACRKERPGACVIHGALVAHACKQQTVQVECAGLVSTVSHSPLAPQARDTARAYYGRQPDSSVTVPALTMDACLEKSGFKQLDFISLDVEGLEAEALCGLNLSRWKPEYMLIECNRRHEVMDVLGDAFEAVEELSPRDVLFRRRR